MTSPLKLREGHIALVRSELPGVSEELEGMYNTLASHGLEPSEKIFKLIQWLAQESAVLKSPDYDPKFTCDACGFNTS